MLLPNPAFAGWQSRPFRNAYLVVRCGLFLWVIMRRDIMIGLLYSSVGEYAALSEACRRGALSAISDINADPDGALTIEVVARDPGGNLDLYEPHCTEILRDREPALAVGHRGQRDLGGENLPGRFGGACMGRRTPNLDVEFFILDSVEKMSRKFSENFLNLKCLEISKLFKNRKFQN